MTQPKDLVEDVVGSLAGSQPISVADKPSQS